MSAGMAGWVEMWLLRRALNARIGQTGLPVDFMVKVWISAIAGGALAWGIKLAIPTLHPVVTAVLVLGPYGVTFFAVALAFRIPEASSAIGRLTRLGR